MTKKLDTPEFKNCPACRNVMKRRNNESNYDYIKRQYCSRDCANNFLYGKQTKDGRFVFKTVADRFLELIEKKLDSDGIECWHWKKFINRSGSGVFNFRDVDTYAHRYAYEQFIGAFPEGKHPYQICGTRGCCNPAHLALLTNEELYNEIRADEYEIALEDRSTLQECIDQKANVDDQDNLLGCEQFIASEESDKEFMQFVSNRNLKYAETRRLVSMKNQRFLATTHKPVEKACELDVEEQAKNRLICLGLRIDIMSNKTGIICCVMLGILVLMGLGELIKQHQVSKEEAFQREFDPIYASLERELEYIRKVGHRSEDSIKKDIEDADEPRVKAMYTLDLIEHFYIGFGRDHALAAVKLELIANEFRGTRIEDRAMKLLSKLIADIERQAQLKI